MTSKRQHFTILSPEDCKHGLITGREMGKGDFGVTFAIDNFTEEYTGAALDALQKATSLAGQFVLKKIALPDGAAISNYAREVHIGRILGDASIAPKIHDFWTCVESGNATYGYIVMDRMSKMWETEYGLKIASDAHQMQLVHCIATMIQRGFLHQDCHVGNIGFDEDDNVVLFDFGLSVEIPPACMDPRSLAIMLASQLQIVIEQYSIPNKNGTKKKRNYLRDVIYAIETDPALTLDRILAMTPDSITKAPPVLPFVSTSFDEQVLFLNQNIVENRKLCPRSQMAFALNSMYKEIERYDTRNSKDGDSSSEVFPNLIYDLIYDIRKGLVNNVNEIPNWVKEKGPTPKKRKTSGGRTGVNTRRKGHGNKKTRKHRPRRLQQVRFMQV